VPLVIVNVPPEFEHAPLLEYDTGRLESLLAATAKAPLYSTVGGACAVTVIVWSVPVVAPAAPLAPTPTTRAVASKQRIVCFVITIPHERLRSLREAPGPEAIADRRKPP